MSDRMQINNAQSRLSSVKEPQLKTALEKVLGSQRVQALL